MLPRQLASALGRATDVSLAASRDIDEVIQACTSALRPHALLLHDGRKRLATSLRSRALGVVSLNHLTYGTGVTVAPAAPEEQTFLLTIPLTGRGRVSYGGSEVSAVTGRTYMIGPYHRFRLDFDDDYSQLVVRLPRARVETAAEQLFGVRLGPGRDLPVHLAGDPAPILQLLSGAITMLPAAVDQPSALRVTAHLEDVLIETLLLAVADRLPAPERPEHPRAATVARAQEYMVAHLSHPVSLTVVATACGVSIRALQQAFREQLGVSPGTWLRDRRLDGAHQALMAAAPGSTTVSDVALRHGFTNFGEFASRFRSRFGVLPSAVLQKHR